MILRRPVMLTPAVRIVLQLVGWRRPRIVMVADYPKTEIGGWIRIAIERGPVTDMDPDEHVPENVRLHETDLVETILL